MSCGGVSQHQVVCLDVISVGAIDQNTTAVWVVIRYSTSSVEWGFNDAQTMTAYGTLDYTWNFQMSTATGSSTNVVVGDLGVSLPVIYGGGNTYGFGAVISGQYLGGTPAHQINFTVPPRPPSPPGTPGVGISSITQTTAYVTVTAPGSNGGAAIDAYETEVWVNGGSRVLIWPNGSGTATGLTPGVTYIARARAHNAAGWGAWSGNVAFTTVAGGRAKVAGTWRNASARAKVNAAWVPAVGVWKKVNGAWVK
jgi:hypothetical protein